MFQIKSMRKGFTCEATPTLDKHFQELKNHLNGESKNTSTP